MALAIFVALGAGMAAPMLAASFVPGAARLLPRPGGWMATLKQVFAFPLYGTAAWLVWVLIQEVGPEGSLMALFGLVVVGFAVWVYGRTRFAATGARRLGGVLAGAGLAAAVALAAMLQPAAGRAPVTNDGLAYEAFTPARLAALTAEHKPVFVNLTAAWCLTCIVNERATLDSNAVRDAFARTMSSRSKATGRGRTRRSPASCRATGAAACRSICFMTATAWRRCCRRS